MGTDFAIIASTKYQEDVAASVPTYWSYLELIIEKSAGLTALMYTEKQLRKLQ